MLPVFVTESWQLTALETPLLVSGIAKTIAPLTVTIPRRIPVFICCTEDSSCANYSYFNAKGDFFNLFFNHGLVFLDPAMHLRRQIMSGEYV